MNTDSQGRVIQSVEVRHPGPVFHFQPSRARRLAETIAFLSEEGYHAHCSNLPALNWTLRWATAELANELQQVAPYPPSFRAS